MTYSYLLKQVRLLLSSVRMAEGKAHSWELYPGSLNPETDQCGLKNIKSMVTRLKTY
jgi:hypothetical protein